MALHHERILCHGQDAWAIDQANGLHKCSCGCGKVLRLVHTGEPWPARAFARPNDLRVAGLELDAGERDAERREALMSSPDFTKPYGEAA